MAKHAKHARESQDDPIDVVAKDLAGESVPALDPDVTGTFDFDAAGNDAPEAVQGMSVHKRKSRRMRIVLIVVSVVLVLLLAALGYFAVQLYNEANEVASQATTSTDDAVLQTDVASEAKDSGDRLTAPALAGLIGMTQDEAIDAIGRGATVSSSKEITEESGEGDDKESKVTGTQVTLALTDQAADAKGNTPSVYLTLNTDGVITQAGYSASVSTLGYGDLSFSDAVQEKHVVEVLLGDAGLTVEEGSITMPAREDYTTYASDNTTITQEQYTFTGTAQQAAGGDELQWTFRLNYDYSAANVSNDLTDTLRLFYMYVGTASE